MELEVPYTVCFSSPIKPKVPIDKVEEVLSNIGFSMQYQLTSPRPLSKANQAKQEAISMGKTLLAIARSSLPQPNMMVHGQKKDSAGMLERDVEEESDGVHERMDEESESTLKMDEEAQVSNAIKRHNLSLSKKLDKFLEEMCKMQTQLEALKNDHQQLFAENEALKNGHQKLFAENEALKNDHQKLAIEFNIFGSLGISRRLAVLDLLTLEVDMMDWYLQEHASKVEVNDPTEYSQLKMTVFKDNEGITFLKFWWWYCNELFYGKKILYGKKSPFNLHKFWKKKLTDYHPPQGLLKKAPDAGEWPLVGTPSSRLAAMTTYEWMKKAAVNFMSYGTGVEGENQSIVTLEKSGKSDEFMTASLLIDSMAFHISVLRTPRNSTIHLLENLFRWPDAHKAKKRMKRKRPHKGMPMQGARCTKTNQPKGMSMQQAGCSQPVCREETQAAHFPYSINMQVVDRAIVFLTDIIESVDNLEDDLKPIKTNVRWFSQILLKECQDALNKAPGGQNAQAETSDMLH